LPADLPEFPDAGAGAPEPEWPSNYFNYFTEIEEYFQQARGTSLFLLSPLDWALIETWKNAGVPLEAVLRGIDAAFEKWRSRRSKTQQVNSLAYCAQAVTKEAQRLLDQQTGVSLEPLRRNDSTGAPFTREALLRYLEANAAALENAADAAIQQLGASLRAIATEASTAPENLSGLDTEDLERRLTTLEGKLLAQLRVQLTEDRLLAIRRELDAQLKPYRSKMNATQLRQLEDQYFERKLLEAARLPRLSLFYMTDYGL
jgi:hypothetical protein